jgi:hypothetical protein
MREAHSYINTYNNTATDADGNLHRYSNAYDPDGHAYTDWHANIDADP